ncbi:anaerobic ribonucleoside-triphosphate reductase activating protein [Candidatus Saccharibacteria bacterium]|nr:MAG: anaerobic ribonucleoside-triphosphate reductase activating protein [Candidatus Saccharibacteria bacterium]
MPIGGLQKVSLVDYPGHTAASIFTLGCNMRCGYCHNPELVLPEQFLESIPVAMILDWLEKRRGKLDGVVVSGGEPTIHQDLPRLIKAIKTMGYLVKLDTNGTHPDMLADLIADSQIDFVAMDIKGPLARYSEIAARPIDTDAVVRSIRLVIDSGIDHELRTTIVRSQLQPEEFHEIGQLAAGAKRFALQKFRPGKTLSPQFAYESAYDDEQMQGIKSIMEKYVATCVIH